MSNYERNPGTVTVWQASKSELEQSPKRPAMTGELKTPNGETLSISLWWATDKESGKRKSDKNNNHYLTGNIQVPQSANTGATNNSFNNTNKKEETISSWEIN
jgi:hypothetical protein